MRAAFAGDRRHRARQRATAAASRAVYAYLEGTLTDPPDSQAAYDTVDRVRDAVHAVPGADAKVGGNTAVNLDVQRRPRHDRNLIIPIVLVVVLLILAVLLRAVVAPLLLIATVVLSFARRARRQRAGLPARLRLRRRGHARSRCSSSCSWSRSASTTTSS